MPDDKELGGTEDREEPQEELFEDPITPRSVKISTDIGDRLQAIGEVSISMAQVAELTETLQRSDALLRAVSQAGDRFVAGALEPLNQLGQLGEQFVSSMNMGLQVQLSPIIELSQSIKSMLDRYEAAYQALVTSYLAPWQEALDRIGASFRPLLDEITRAQVRQVENTLRRYHWWLVPGMPPEFYKDVLELIEQGQTRRINRHICDWFRWNRYRRLGRMVRRWDTDEFFRRRRHIYIQALKAHRRGWYNLTVPALVPLVEGVARDYLQEKHGLSERRGKKAIEKALAKNIPTGVFREELQQALIRFLTSSTFADTDRNDVLPSGYELNRHGVTHSRHLRYGTEANSLRCFLLLETLYHFISDRPHMSWS